MLNFPVSYLNVLFLSFNIEKICIMWILETAYGDVGVLVDAWALIILAVERYISMRNNCLWCQKKCKERSKYV